MLRNTTRDVFPEVLGLAFLHFRLFFVTGAKEQAAGLGINFHIIVIEARKMRLHRHFIAMLHDLYGNRSQQLRFRLEPIFELVPTGNPLAADSS